MITGMLHRLFGIGKIPAAQMRALQPEGIQIAGEGVAGSLPYRNHRAPGKVFVGGRRWFVGSLAITGQRFVAYAFSRKLLAAPLNHPGGAKRCAIAQEGRSLTAESYSASTVNSLPLRRQQA